MGFPVRKIYTVLNRDNSFSKWRLFFPVLLNWQNTEKFIKCTYTGYHRCVAKSCATRTMCLYLEALTLYNKLNAYPQHLLFAISVPAFAYNANLFSLYTFTVLEFVKEYTYRGKFQKLRIRLSPNINWQWFNHGHLKHMHLEDSSAVNVWWMSD